MGEVFAGRYELVDLVGMGGMGSVWRAWDHRDRQYVAAKVLGQSDAASLLRFLREQSHRVQHPHVVTPMSWAGEDDRVLFTMPLVRGGSVATLLGDYGKLPPSWTCVLLDQLLDALGAVHAAGLVHRDVKPSNLLLEPTGTARPHLRLSDFGIATAAHLDRLTLTGQVVGTPAYLAPELLAGAPPDPRQDLYAAGLVAAAMIVGPRRRRGPRSGSTHPSAARTRCGRSPGACASPARPSDHPTPRGPAQRSGPRCRPGPWRTTSRSSTTCPRCRRAGRRTARSRRPAAGPVPVVPVPAPAPPGPTDATGSTGSTGRALWPALVLAVAGAALLVAAVVLLTG